MMAKIKLFLWKIGLYPNKCPYCGKELLNHGFPGYNERWTCPNEECRFNGEEAEK